MFFEPLDLQKQYDEEINEEINEVYQIILRKGGIKAKMIAEEVKRPKKTIDRYLKKLKDLKIIIYKGSNKTGGYYKS